MRNIYEVLREKEHSIERVRREIEALRLVCSLLQEEGDSITGTFEAHIEREEPGNAVVRTDEQKAWLAPIRAQLASAQRNHASTGVLIQFRRAALGASRRFLKRVLDSPMLEREPQRKSIQDFFKRHGLSNAA